MDLTVHSIGGYKSNKQIANIFKVLCYLQREKI